MINHELQHKMSIGLKRQKILYEDKKQNTSTQVNTEREKRMFKNIIFKYIIYYSS